MHIFAHCIIQQTQQEHANVCCWNVPWTSITLHVYAVLFPSVPDPTICRLSGSVSPFVMETVWRTQHAPMCHINHPNSPSTGIVHFFKLCGFMKFCFSFSWLSVLMDLRFHNSGFNPIRLTMFRFTEWAGILTKLYKIVCLL